MIERVRVDPLLHCICPLIVGDCHVSNRPSDRSPKSFGHLSHRRRFAHQSVRTLKRRTRIGQDGCGYMGYVFRADEWNDRRILAPWQEHSAFFSDASANKSTHVFVIGWCLEMNGAHLRPVEDAIRQPMLQIAGAGSTS